MDKFKEFISSKGFYIALTIGVVAFAVLLGVQNYKKNKSELEEQMRVDLNAPKVAGSTTESMTDKKENIVSDASSSDVKNVVKNDDTKNEVKSEVKVDEAKAGNTDAASSTDAGLSDYPDDKVTPEEYGIDTTEVNADNSAVANFTMEDSIKWPLQGEIIMPYSMDKTTYYKTLNMYKCNPGVLIAGEQGANIISAFGGVVEKIEDTKEYGTTVTIDMGNGYKAVYGQVMNVCVNEGDTVETGQNIAEVGCVSSYYKEEGPHLFFEISKDGEPVNPMTLMK